MLPPYEEISVVNCIRLMFLVCTYEVLTCSVVAAVIFVVVVDFLVYADPVVMCCCLFSFSLRHLDRWCLLVICVVDCLLLGVVVIGHVSQICGLVT